MLDVTFPTALRLLTDITALSTLGPGLLPALILVAFRIVMPHERRALDILVLPRSGHIAVGECKRATGGPRATYQAATIQATHYARLIRRFGKDPGWLPRDIESAYTTRYGFPDISMALAALAIPLHQQNAWWECLARRCRAERIPTFVAIPTHKSHVPTIMTSLPGPDRRHAGARRARETDLHPSAPGLGSQRAAHGLW